MKILTKTQKRCQTNITLKYESIHLWKIFESQLFKLKLIRVDILVLKYESTYSNLNLDMCRDFKFSFKKY